MMIRHHLDAVHRGAQCVVRASEEHGRLEELCGDIVEDQLAEIRRMKEWLCDWHHVCR